MNRKSMSLLAAVILTVLVGASAHAQETSTNFFEVKVAGGQGYFDPNLGIDVASGQPTTATSFSYNTQHFKVGVEEIKVQSGETPDATSPANERRVEARYRNSIDTLLGEFKYEGAITYRAMNKDTANDDYVQVSLRAGRPYQFGTWTVEPYVRSEQMIPVKYNNQLHIEAVGLNVTNRFANDTVFCLKAEYVQDINSFTATAHRRFTYGEVCAQKTFWQNVTLSGRVIYIQYRGQDSDYVPTLTRDGKVLLLRPRTSNSIDPTENTLLAQFEVAVKFDRVPFMK